MDAIVAVVLVSLAIATAPIQDASAQGRHRPPIIDMHLHADNVADYGPTPTVCSDNRSITWIFAACARMRSIWRRGRR